MREMTAAELKTWQLGKWPCGCKTQSYLKGPAGGLCRNIECPNCGLRINVIDPETHLPSFMGQVLREPPGYSPPKETTLLAVRSAWARFRFSRVLSFLKVTKA